MTKAELENLSTEQLRQMAELNSLSTEELRQRAGQQAQPPQEQSFGDTLLQGIGTAAEAVDTVTGAPVRAGIGALQQGGGISDALSAAGAQFGTGAVLETTPTGTQINQAAGLDFGTEALIPESVPLIGGITGSDIAGFGTEVIADLTNIIPGVAAAKAAGRAAKATAKGTAKLAGKSAARIGGYVIPEGVKSSLGRTAKGMKDAFIPDKLATYKQDVATAVRNGIDPNLLTESVEFGNNSIPGLAAQQVESNLAGGLRRQAHEDLYETVGQKFQDRIAEKYGVVRDATGVPTPLSKREAGEAIRAEFDSTLSDVLGNEAVSYASLANRLGNTFSTDAAFSTIAKLNKLKSRALDEAKTLSDTQQAANLVRLGKIIDITKESISTEGAQGLAKNIGVFGRRAFQKSANLDPSIQRLQKDLYDALREGFVRNVKASGLAEEAEQLVKNNQIITDFMRESEGIRKVLAEPTADGRSIYNKIISNAEEADLQAFKRIFQTKPELIDNLKGTYLTDVFKGAIDPETGKVIPKFKEAIPTLYNTDKRGAGRVFNQLFDGQLPPEIDDLVGLGMRIGPSTRQAAITGLQAGRELSTFFKIAAGSETMGEISKILARKKAAARAAETAEKRLTGTSPSAKKGTLKSLITGSAVKNTLKPREEN